MDKDEEKFKKTLNIQKKYIETFTSACDAKNKKFSLSSKKLPSKELDKNLYKKSKTHFTISLILSKMQYLTIFLSIFFI